MSVRHLQGLRQMEYKHQEDKRVEQERRRADAAERAAAIQKAGFEAEVACILSLKW